MATLIALGPVVMLPWALLFLPQFWAAPHATEACWRFCVSFSSSEYSEYLAYATSLWIFLAAIPVAIGLRWFRRQNPE